MGTCTCEGTDLIFKGDGCVPYEACPSDNTYNDGLNQCKECEPNCEQCLDFDGRCSICEEGYLLLAGYCTQFNAELD